MKKKYITKQDDITDCGAASVSSIIKYYGGFVSLETLRQESFTNKEGTTAYHLVNVLKKYGFDAYGIKCEENIDFFQEKIVLPAIAHIVLNNNLQHFIVIYQINFKEKNLLVMDPAIGYKTLNINDFINMWTKNLIICTPKTKILKYKNSKSLISKFIKLFSKEKALILKIIIISFILTIVSIVSSFFLKITLSNIEYEPLLKKNIGLFFIILILKIIINYFRVYYENILNKNIDVRVIIPFLKHILSIPLSYLKNKTTGEIVTRVKELNNIKSLFSKIFVTIFLDLVLASLSLIIIYKLNNIVFYLLILILIIYLIVSLIYSLKIKNNLENIIEEETNFNTLLIENINNIETIKNNNLVKMKFQQIKKQFLNYLTKDYQLADLLNKESTIQGSIEELGIFIIMVIGIFLVINNKLSILDLFTLNSLIIFLITPFKNTVNLLPEINYVKASFAKINGFLSIKDENLNKQSQIFQTGNIKIRHLSFSYDQYHYILKDLNLNIKENEHVMLKGTSGSGKSTLCHLFLKTYQYEGNILINNYDITNYNLNTLRNNIVYLSQNETLFSDSIYNNLTLNKRIKYCKLDKILNICQINEILNNKQLGLETMLMENNYNLSGGEKQRLILARSLLKETKIIILDEPLSEVESSLESKIIKELNKEFKDKTIIYITHRNMDALFDRVINL